MDSMTARGVTPRYEPFAPNVPPAILALWVFIAAEALFFGILIASYLYLRVHVGMWPPPGYSQPDLLLPAVNTLVLLSSGFTMHGALACLRRGNVALLKDGIIATLLLGSAFLVGQAFEYAHAGFGLSDGLLGSSFYTLTGFHGAHVLGGLIFLAMVLGRARRGHYTQERHLAVEAATLYWHFVDAVWIVLFTMLYLV
ncbi:MAG: cytochrome c oxidase subunit 3 [Chloroflexota bacterium]|jgi:cytochrome c oxidase subunit 3